MGAEFCVATLVGEQRRGEGSNAFLERKVFSEGFQGFLDALLPSETLPRTEEGRLGKQYFLTPSIGHI